jgi:hypothetical protein
MLSRPLVAIGADTSVASINTTSHPVVVQPREEDDAA